MADPARAPAARRKPSDFLELVRRARAGRLKVYIGPAAGVGKTYRMLQEAHELRQRGVDVVIGVIVTHGRADTEALVGDLEQVPLRTVEYRGLTLQEMDLEAVLARRPDVVLVDEIAHTNAPGGRHQRRYEDALALVDAGVNVICAFNVQHLESLNDVVERTTGVTVRETVPDTFLRRADLVVDIDLPGEDLIERLRTGKIYGHERVPWALEHFFREDRLAVLRELALREVAETVDRGETARLGEDGLDASGHVGGRLLVGIDPRSPRTRQLLRLASRMAGRLNTRWFVVHVEARGDRPDQIDATTQRHLADAVELARDLGAEVMRLPNRDPATGLIDFARAHRVRDIVVGASRAGWLARTLGWTLAARLLRRGKGFNIHVLSLDGDEGPP